MRVLQFMPVLLVILATSGASAAGSAPFARDAEFLEHHAGAFVLGRGPGRIVVAPAYQGRVMTSTADGTASFGWLNYPVISNGCLTASQRQGRLEDHIHVFGGEERFWLGPEGGQFSIFFAPGAKFEFADWHTPAPLDTEPFQVLQHTDTTAAFMKAFVLTNYSGARLEARVDRTVRVLDAAEIEAVFEIELGRTTRSVAYETDNRLTNVGTEPWTRARGALSIWLLGMYNPSPQTTVVIPFRAGPDDQLGPRVNDAYFGKVPPDYLVLRDNVLFFRGDGTRRGKIGIPPARSFGLAGSYDAAGRVLTLIACNVPRHNAGYVNSMWELQKEPFHGDAINAYNDGSPAPGQPPLGPFYELETSSPAALLAPGETLRHVQRTLHVTGPEADLDRIARRKLGVGLAEIRAAFPAR